MSSTPVSLSAASEIYRKLVPPSNSATEKWNLPTDLTGIAIYQDKKKKKKKHAAHRLVVESILDYVYVH